jgi:flagellar FliL protein
MEKESSNKLLIGIIIFLILVVVGGTIGVVWYIAKPDVVPQKKIEQAQNSADETLAQIGPLYPIAPITVNLRNPDGKDIYLKATFSLELNDKELSHELDAKNAVIRDEIIRILSSKTVNDVSFDMGKAKITQAIKDKINSMLSDGQIRNVYIVSFIIQ